MPKYQQPTENQKNYNAEAAQLIKPLPTNQLYELYEIVWAQQKKSQSDNRRKELEAVQRAIESVSRLQPERLQGIREGYKSSMAQDARAKDGNTRPNRKKV